MSLLASSLRFVEENQAAFWGAVVQIIPVLLLALVVEARGLKRLDHREMRLHFRRLRARHGTKRLRDRVRVATAMMGKVAFTGFLPAYVMLIVALMLVLGEFLGLMVLLYGTSISAWASSFTVIAIIAGVGTVAVSPVLLRFAEAWRETDPDDILRATVTSRREAP
ncbi:hypothetical protein [Microbacterium sp. SS28]|uniref:hypothetical protein n=1 Tax=Microbacterium sp. SS28 TaxID=2919948 RepID=UPI001FA942E7|nr:hypothetical protein [Microbacterium sp. SS28]